MLRYNNNYKYYINKCSNNLINQSYFIINKNLYINQKQYQQLENNQQLQKKKPQYPTLYSLFNKQLFLNSNNINNNNNRYNNSSINYKYYTTTNNNNNNNNNNKILLKKFFLKVHPDLFYQYPNIKNNNNESLRVFLGFLEEIKNEKLTKKSYNIKFYYQDDNIYDNELDIPSVSINFDIDLATSSTNSFDKLLFTLSDAQNQIKSLFKQIGINDGEFILHNMISRYNSGNGNGNGGMVESLLQFIKNISPIAREQQISFIEQEREVDLMYTYFYMEHKIRVLFQDHDMPLKLRKDYLRKLEKILNKISPRKEINQNIIQEVFDKSNFKQNNNNFSFKSNYNSNNFNKNDNNSEELNNNDDDNNSFGNRVNNKQRLFSEFGVFSGKNKENFQGWEKIKSGYITPLSNPKSDSSELRDRLEGVSVVFSKVLDSGIDLEGRLILNSNEKPSDWTKVLKSFKPSEIVTNIQKCKERQSIEKELSKSLRIASIFTDYSYQNSQDYLEFLDKLFNQYKEQLLNNNGYLLNNNSYTVSLDEININIIKDQDTDKIQHWSFNSKLVSIQVPLCASFSDIVEFLQNNQDQIKQKINQHKINMRNLAQLELTVKRQFRLTRLKKIDDSIGMNEMVVCLKRLLTNNSPFLPYLYGMKLIIGNENKINFDGSIIIKWDFEL